MSIQFAGGTIVNNTFTPTNKATLQSNVMSNLVTAGWSQATGHSGGGSQVVTISIASPGVVSLAAHGLLANDSVVFSTTGALPTGLTAGAQYFVKTVLTSGTFTVSASSGGTVINTSGSQSGTQSMVGCVRMQSASTPWSVSMRLRLQDNGGTCITFSIENSTSSLAGGNSTTSGGQLNPGSGAITYRIIANKYQAFIFQPSVTPGRGFVSFGTPYLPTFLQGVLTECSWMSSNAQSDTDTTARNSFRNTLNWVSVAGGNVQGIANTNLGEIDNSVNSQWGAPCIFPPGAVLNSGINTLTGLIWTDQSALMSEPLIAWGTSMTNGSQSAAIGFQALLRGQLWDAVVICNIFTGDTTTTFDGHTWLNICDTSTNLGSLFVATS